MALSDLYYEAAAVVHEHALQEVAVVHDVVVAVHDVVVMMVAAPVAQSLVAATTGVAAHVQQVEAALPSPPSVVEANVGC